MARKAVAAWVVAAVMLAQGPARAADSEVETLREQLRSTVLQLRQLQDQQAAATVAPAPAQIDPAAKAKLGAANAQAHAAQRKVAEVQAEVDKAKAENAAMTASLATTVGELDRFKSAYAQAEESARALTAERDRLNTDLARTTAIAGACQAKNDRLTALAETMLADYHKVRLGGVLSAREPVFQLRRVQLENLAQDREDAIRANHCDPRIDAAGAVKRAAGALIGNCKQTVANGRYGLVLT